MKKRIGKYVSLCVLWCLSFLLIFSEIECEYFVVVFMLTKVAGMFLAAAVAGMTVRAVVGDERLKRFLED